MTQKKTYRTHSDLPLKCFYEEGDGSKTHLKKLGAPGKYPFVRGIHPQMYRTRFWTMRQYAGFGTAEQSNLRYRYLIDQGVSGLSVAFDLPTQLGLDPDDPKSHGEVGRVGVSIATIDDMRVLFQGIKLDQVSTSMTINATSNILFAFYVAIAKEQGVDLKNLRGTVQNDIFKEYIARGNYIYPVIPSLKLTVELFAFCAKHTPKWNPISVSGYHIREAGATAIEELAFTFLNAKTYLRAAQDAGLCLKDFVGQVSFFWNVHQDFFEEVAKFRAARRIWAKLLKETFGIEEEKLLKHRFHCQTAGSTLTAQQPMNNVVRVTLQALSAVLGGAQSLHTNALDEALSLPTQETAKLALRTQQILAHETGVTQVVDPLGGSWFLEHLTQELEEKTWEKMSNIESRGGMVACIEEGVVQREILSSAYRDQKMKDRKERKVVGVNCFEEESEDLKIVQKVSSQSEEEAKKKIQLFRKNRNFSETHASLKELKKIACLKEPSLGSLQQAVLKAVLSKATLGEIAQTLKEVYGAYQVSSEF